MEPNPRHPFYSWLTGDQATFSLEARIFHSVCLIMLCGIGLNVPFNYLIGLPSLAAVMALAFLVTALVYYLSRFRGMMVVAVVIFQLGANAALILNYLHNAGLDGPTYAICLLWLFVSIATIPRSQYFVWLPLNVVCVLGLFAWDYSHSGWIAAGYPDRASRFTDFGYTYLVIAAVVIFITLYIRRSYYRQAAQLAAASELKNKLLSILAHDLREPINSIQGFLEVLTAESLGEEQRRELRRELLQRTRNAAELLVNLLSWTRGQLEGRTPKAEKVRLAGLIETVIAQVGPQAADKSVILKAGAAGNACVQADPDLLQLVLRNLLTNAIKFSYPGGIVRVLVQQTPRDCLVKVVDQGVGIPAVQQRSLFTSETNAQSGTEKERGAGLGLFLCREFMQKQGGTIDFTSNEGEGAMFWITLPCCNDAQ
jgi:two-component system sensor histidine kinase/response regulator